MTALTVFIDPAASPEDRQKELIKKMLSEIGVSCEFVAQCVERTLSWQPKTLEKTVATEDIMKETVAVIFAKDVVTMVQAYMSNKTKDALCSKEQTLTDWVKSVQQSLPGQNLTILAVGLSQYFNAQKRTVKQKHREAVTGQPARGKKKKDQLDTVITREQLEEAEVELQLMTGCILQPVDSDEELANQIKLFTKAVADKPAKKDRLDNVFSFLEEGPSGLRVSKDGEGLSKVWKKQLTQFKNLGPEMAEAVCNAYPSPYLLHEACKSCPSRADAEKNIAEINVRRNASIIATNRKVGKEQARRIYTFATSSDPNEIIK